MSDATTDILKRAESLHPTRDWPPTNPRTGDLILIPDDMHTCDPAGHEHEIESMRSHLFSPPEAYTNLFSNTMEAAQRFIDRSRECPECIENRKRKAAYYVVRLEQSIVNAIPRLETPGEWIPMIDTTAPLHDHLTRTILACEFDVRKKEDALSESKRLLRIAQDQLTDAMLDGRVPTKFDANGETWTLDNSTYVTPLDKDHTYAVIEAIIAHGGQDLVKPTMHHKTRDAFLHDVVVKAQDDGIPRVPDWLKGLVKVETLPKIRRRKG